MQIVTSEASELFRIYWHFNDTKTVTERMASAVATGEAVDYRVVDGSGVYEFSGKWRFSSTAGITLITRSSLT